MKIDRIIKDGRPSDPYIISVNETRRVADILENSNKFEQIIIKLRNKYKMPANGYSYETEFAQEEWLFDNKGFVLDEFFAECEILTKELNLPQYWYGTVAYFAMYNIFITPERIPIEIKYLQFKDDYLTGTHIVIKEKISKAEVHKWVDESWKNIEREMESLPEAKGHKMQRSEIAKEIVRLKDEEEKTYKQIAENLGKKYIDSELFDILNEDYVKILYHRWKKLSKFKK